MTTFNSGLSASISSYLTLKRTLGRQYAAEERVLAHLDRFLAARRVDLVAETFAAWCLTLQHLASGTRRARMRIVRNLCLYRGRSEPGYFVPDERLFPPDHQAIRPHIFTDNEIVQLLAVARTLARSAKSPLRPKIRLAIVVLSTTGLRRGELTQSDRRRLRPTAAHAGGPPVQVPQVAPRPAVGGYRPRGRAPDRAPRSAATASRGGESAPLASPPAHRRLHSAMVWAAPYEHSSGEPVRDGSSPTHA